MIPARSGRRRFPSYVMSYYLLSLSFLIPTTHHTLYSNSRNRICNLDIADSETGKLKGSIFSHQARHRGSLMKPSWKPLYVWSFRIVADHMYYAHRNTSSFMVAMCGDNMGHTNSHLDRRYSIINCPEISNLSPRLTGPGCPA